MKKEPVDERFSSSGPVGADSEENSALNRSAMATLNYFSSLTNFPQNTTRDPRRKN